MATTPTGPPVAILPECWGHRGASSRFPENSLASFEAAMRDGAEGIESDVHVSLDGVVVMFHDPNLKRTTGSDGLIRERNWYGPDGIEHLRTIKEPKQSIPTFAETLTLLMKPENRHIKFNIDVKVWNDPERLFTLMHEIISSHEDWEQTLAPRLLLGLWHPKFIPFAVKVLPYMQRSYIGISPTTAREYFWDACDAFSLNFGAWITAEGMKLRKDAKAAGKKVLVWTVNKPEEMMECVRIGVDVILTDYTKVWLELRNALAADFAKSQQFGRLFLWTSPWLYTPTQSLISFLFHKRLEKIAGPFEKFPVESAIASAPAAISAAA